MLNEEQKMNLIEALDSGNVVTVEFEKANGEIRTMHCVKKPEDVGMTYEYKGSPVKAKEGLQHVWDVDKGAWRAFKMDSVIDYKV